MSQSSRMPQAGARWCAAIICLFYGFAKINGSQFAVIDSELARPMGEVSGFWLTWYYFSYSRVYGTGVALLQIVGGGMLIMPRTVRLGAAMLLPVVVNIILIDIVFAIALAPLILALVLLGCLLAILSPSMPELRRILLPDSVPLRPSRGALGGLALVTAAAFAATFYIAHRTIRAPTVIDGTWRADRATTLDSVSGHWPEVVFFEYNRAQMAVFRRNGAADAVHNFEIDSAGAVRIWKTWLQHDSLLLTGHRVAPTTIVLRRAAGPDTSQLVLRRVALPGEVERHSVRDNGHSR